jgi:hypothetical protein
MPYTQRPAACNAGARAAKFDVTVENVPCNSTTGRWPELQDGSLTPDKPTEAGRADVGAWVLVSSGAWGCDVVVGAGLGLGTGLVVGAAVVTWTAGVGGVLVVREGGGTAPVEHDVNTNTPAITVAGSSDRRCGIAGIVRHVSGPPSRFPIPQPSAPAMTSARILMPSAISLTELAP